MYAHPRRRRRAPLASVVAALVLVMSVVVGTPQLSAAAVPSRPEGGAALDWIEAELAANDHAMPGFVPDSPDWGLTADAVLALAAGGRSTSPEAVATATNVLANARSFATYDDFDMEGVRIAGSLAKLLVVAEAQGVDSSDADGLDLEAELRASMQAAGADGGRFSDSGPDVSDNANGFGQALAVIGLSYTEGGVPPAGVGFLLDQQCPGGGFRLVHSPAGGCTTASAADTDATAMAVQALLVVPRTIAVRDALIEALGWLADEQDPSGGFGGTGPTSGLNSSSTGLIAQALLASGRAEAAGNAADWIVDETALVEGASGAASADAGSIAYNPGAHDAAVAEGIDDLARDQWRRSTAQAVLALGLSDYGSLNRDPAPTVGTLTSTGAFVSAAYEDFLERAPTPAELSDAVADLDEGIGRGAVLRELVESDESIGRLVTGFYVDTLDRQPDEAGRRYWIDEIRSGHRTVARVASGFYSSAEYYGGLGGGTPTTWIDDLYERLLGRPADAGGRDYWVGQVATRGRAGVALLFYDSLESRGRRVDALYAAVLDRPADPAGREYWAGRILSKGDLVVAVELATGREYFERAATRFP